MTCADLHLHSCYSKHPAEWFLKRLGTQESYTDIDFLYRSAKERGMSFVTLTDHNTIQGALELHRRYPEDTFVSVEVTAYFPENGCKVHVLVYDIDEDQFKKIEAVRTNIYDLREFLLEQEIVHSLAHATYSVNERLNADLVEKLLLLFNTFEGVNGARSPYYAKKWMKLLKELTPGDMDRLSAKHGIKPHGPAPWSKGITAGSDDHAGLFQALTFTRGPQCRDPKTFLAAVRNGQTRAEGRSHDFKTFAFSIYKIAYDFSKHKTSADSHDLFNMISSILFDQNGALIASALIPKDQNTPSEGAAGEKNPESLMLEFMEAIARDLADTGGSDMDTKFNRIYASLSSLVDNYFVMVMDSMADAVDKLSLVSFLKNLFASLPFFFLSTPFVTSVRHLTRDRIIINRLREQMDKPEAPSGKRVLWFTDTIHDLNGVSASLRQIAWHAHRTDRNLTLVTCHPGSDKIQALPPNVMNLDSVYSYRPELYTSYTMYFPSLLKAIDRISTCNPERVIISTPGPVGLLGLMAARMLNIPSTGVYHTDFKTQLDLTIKDHTLSSLIFQYDRMFFTMMDEIRVPSMAYVDILNQRGYPGEKLKIFERGINTSLYRYREQGNHEKADSQEPEFTLVWAGRVSHDKNIAYLLEVFELARKEIPGIRLVMAGHGPDYDYFKEITAGIKNVEMKGRVPYEKLPGFYSAGDLFVFPSTMDTFGMVVLEAQACGLPGLVTDIGGPQEIVENGVTGSVLSLARRQDWVSAIQAHARRKAENPEEYRAYKKKISRKVHTQFSWEKALTDMIDLPNRSICIRGEALYAKSA
ncbi:glycosyltransferase [Desulfospira joergensenii]|uniref:glycosyltransferase n=1 Tax=Desulfospira joergensenii TaxID=53329 RepID=UPI0003B3DD0A|nr:glycosyltransferase [Desulfospira joergensenii]